MSCQHMYPSLEGRYSAKNMNYYNKTTSTTATNTLVSVDTATGDQNTDSSSSGTTSSDEEETGTSSSSSSSSGTATKTTTTDPDWTILPINQLLNSNSEKQQTETTIVSRVDIQWKTRLDPFTTRLPSSLYTPIIYQFEHRLYLSNNNGMNEQALPNVIMVRPKVVFEGDYQSLVLNKEGNMILKGDLEIAMTRKKIDKKSADNEGYYYYGVSKVQFTDSSYHFDRKSFQLGWEYMMDNVQKDVIYRLMSSNFKVYARKPNKKSTSTSSSNKKGEKRSKKEESIEKQQQPLNKKIKEEVVDDVIIVNDVVVEKANLQTKQHSPVLSLMNNNTSNVLCGGNDLVNNAFHIINNNHGNNELMVQLLKTLTDINKRLERLEKLSPLAQQQQHNAHSDMRV